MKAALAIARRDVVRWFTNPAGYIFIMLFIVLCALAQFVLPDFRSQQDFFDENLANLGMLNRYFPFIMILFAAALAMGTWADERRHGTDELLLTLPCADGTLVAGKYFGALAVYLVSLLFTLTLVACLAFIGRPDLGLMLGTYLGYAFLGAGLIAIAMIGSLLVESVVIGFVLGIIFASLPVVLGLLESRLGVQSALRDFGTGVVGLEGIAYFAALGGLGLGINLAYWKLRRLRREKWHVPVRVASLVIALICLTILAERSGARADVTAERLHSLSPLTVETIRAIPADKPIFIQAYVSAQVPQNYVETRENLLALLRDIDARGRGRVHVRITETAKATDAAREAEDRFKIRPVRVAAREDGTGERMDVFLGAAVTGGLDEVVVPFFYRGLSPEYELTRSLRVVSKATRGKVGILATEAKWFGGFDFNSMRSEPAWEIVEELKRQYEVVNVAVDGPITETVDVLIAPMPSSLTQAQLDHLTNYAKQGKPVLLLDDPLPIMNPSIGANEMRGGRRNMMGGAPPEPKGNFREFYKLLGIAWDPIDVVWDTYKPHPSIGELPEEVVFIGRGNGAKEPFSKKSGITSKLQDLVVLFAGCCRRGEGTGIEMTPLLQTGRSSGLLSYGDVWRSNPFFGGGGLNPNRRHIPGADLEGPVVAARFQGKSGDVNVDAVFIADLDLISEQFFELRRRGMEHLNFDNVTFVLNAVDALMRDEATIELRSRRPRHRTLEKIENLRRDYDKAALEGARKAESDAQKLLDEAQKRLDDAVKQIESRTDVDARTKDIQVEAVRDAEQRKFDIEKKRIEGDKEAAIERGAAERDRKVAAIQNGIRWAAVGGASLPAILAAVIAFYLGIRRQLEVRR